MAQQAAVISGGNAIGSNGSSSYSVGQVVFANQAGSNGNTNQGVQQPFEIFVLGTDDFLEIKLEMTLYPNPTSGNATLSIQNYASEKWSYRLFDLNGRIIYEQEISQSETQIALENLSASVYLIAVSDQNKTLKTFKIIKN